MIPRLALLFLGATLLNETILSMAARTADSAAILFIGARFAVLPMFAIALIFLGGRELLRTRLSAEPKGPLLGIALGSTYLVLLYFWPLPWLDLLSSGGARLSH